NAEMLNSEKPRHEKACKLLTSIVNSMTTKMEIGAPMASAYLLEQPDHYTSHKFKPFYWMPFVREAQIVSDYTLRPEFYNEITVYDWMRQAHKEKGQVKLPPPDKDDGTQVHLEGEQDMSEYDTEDEGHGTASPNPTGPLTPHERKHKHVEDNSVDQEDSVDTMDENEITLDDMKFLDGHPQRDSHRIKFSPDNKGLVPNFVGGTLPRSDKGDCEYYCATVLTLFKPWRTGFDLKKEFETWTEAFTSHTFTNRQLQTMRFLQIRFECNDARDDHHAQRLKGHIMSKDNIYFDDDHDLNENSHEDLLYGQLDMTDMQLEDVLDKGYKTLAKEHGMQAAEQIAMTSGWLD
ncbi:hypothetical protein K439DRAFT_1311272, partial [Ramaria rubella]